MIDLLSINDPSGELPTSSYYFASRNSTVKFLKLEESKSCDVCVIGGGLTGLSTAIKLQEKGFKVILLEARRLGFGASGRNGGQVGVGQRKDQFYLEQKFGLSRAKQLWDIGLEATSEVFNLIKKYKIECDYTRGILDVEFRKRHVWEYQKKVEHMSKVYQYDKMTFLTKNILQERLGSEIYYGGLQDNGGAHIHPLNFVLGLAKAAKNLGVQIFEQSRVKRFHENGKVSVELENGTKVVSNFLVLGCNGYIGSLDKNISSWIMPINNYIIATEPLGEQLAKRLIRDNVAVHDSKFVVNYFRLSADKRLIFGGGESYRYKFPQSIEKKARDPMIKVFPYMKDVKIDYSWGGTLAVTQNRLPSFQRVERNIFSASGYSGHGVALATFSGQILADVISGQAEKFDIMSSLPKLKFPGGELMRWPLLVLGMTYYALKDKLP